MQNLFHYYLHPCGCVIDYWCCKEVITTDLLLEIFLTTLSRANTTPTALTMQRGHLLSSTHIRIEAFTSWGQWGSYLEYPHMLRWATSLCPLVGFQPFALYQDDMSCPKTHSKGMTVISPLKLEGSKSKRHKFSSCK